MCNYLYPSKEEILALLFNDIFYKNYNTLDYINRLSTENFCSYPILQKLPDNISNIWSDIGIELDKSYNIEKALLRINKAFEYINDYDPVFMFFNVNVLVKSIHLLKSNNEYNDISFSDPNLPYTVFINLPGAHVNNWLERTVENLIHEAMHLQLSLLEKENNFYIKTNAKIFSPWKNEPRNNRGILHAVYVFFHLKIFWGKVYSSKKCLFSKNRIKDINEQLALINFNQLSDFYTEKGKSILRFCLGPIGS